MMLEKMKGYKTVVFAGAVFLLGVLQSTGANDALNAVGLAGNGTLHMVIGSIIAGLRWFTTSPIFSGDKPT